MSRSMSSTARPASTVPTSPSSEHNHEDPTIEFTNTQDLFQVINCISGDFLIVTHVSPSDFAEIEEERVIRRRKYRWRRYHAESRILVVAIPTGVHETLHLLLYEKYRDQLCGSGIQKAWTSIGDSGEGDSTGGPKPQCVWPTLVIQAGDSESLNQLRMDMQWWFAASNHDVKIVILAKFDRGQSRVILEKWEEAAATSAALQPVLQQTITISRNQATNPVSYDVTRGALVLEFRLLFLRDPGLGQGDFIISIPDLQEYAEAVWARV
ncbi:hypothetical protein F4677DRAFT_465652 [Hypoxylon crocopeplum]|nr:hypothetical protein F4677DRAFT_465652 [Hypoxylon crocopeplum]